MNNSTSMPQTDDDSLAPQAKATSLRFGGWSGSTLKIIAIVTMFIDHFAASVFERMLAAAQLAGAGASIAFFGTYHNLYLVYGAMRLIGRIAFPLFCFLLVEGFLHTHDIKKYALRLCIFAVLSEIPFDLALFSRPIYFAHQNVFLTLALALLVLWGIQAVNNTRWHPAARAALATCIVAAGALAADLLRTDYGAFGVLTVVVIFLLHKRKWLAGIGACSILTAMTPIEAPGFFALLPICLYNGKRGLRLKYFFYIFYPAHLLALYLLCLAMGLV